MNGNSSAGTVNMNMLHVVGDSWAGSKTMIKHGECGEQGRKQKKEGWTGAFSEKTTHIYIHICKYVCIYIRCLHIHMHAYVYAYKIVVYKAGG